MYLVPLNCTLKLINFILHIFYYIINKQILHDDEAVLAQKELTFHFFKL